MQRSLLLVIVLAFSPIHATDWFTLMNSNYAAIQTGLSQLNNASTALNRALSSQQQVIQDAFSGLVQHVNRSLVKVRTQYPSVDLTSSGLNPDGFQTYVANLVSQFRSTVTNSVMIPAQKIVSSVLGAMSDFYSKYQYNDCAKQKAADLMQSRISMGRFGDCLLANVPFVEKIAKVANFSLNSASKMVDAGIDQLSYCSAGSVNCTSTLLNAWPNEYAILIGALNNIQSIYPYYSDPGVAINQACAKLITIDIQDAIQAVRNGVASC